MVSVAQADKEWYKMTCKRCIHFSECESLAMSSFDHSHKMWMIDFWGNAHERCEWFKETGGEKSEWCVACGNEIPEGRMVCALCEFRGSVKSNEQL